MREWCLFRASFATSELLAISEDVPSHSGPTTRCGIAALGDGAEWSRMGFIPQDQTVHRVSITAVSNWLYLIHHRYFAINLECLRPKLFCAILDTRRANRWHHSLRLVAHQGQPRLNRRLCQCFSLDFFWTSFRILFIHPAHKLDELICYIRNG